MDAISFYPGCRLSSLSTSRKLRQGHHFVSLKELAVRPIRLALNKNSTPTLSVRANSNKTGQTPGESEGTSKGGDGAKLANQEEIIALFRHIQSSISKGDPISTIHKRRISSRPSQGDYKHSTESVLKVLRQSRRQVKDGPSSKMGANEELALKEPVQQQCPSQVDFKVTRPPSNFVKRSPIPSPASPREKVAFTKNTVGLETEMERIEDMKVTELKELAKSRGIKGYSKLKKNGLIELLRSFENGCIT